MGKRDSATKKCLKDKSRFADLFNAILFDGKQVIEPSSLEELDSTIITLIPQFNKKVLNIQKFRDIIKEAIIMRDANNSYVLLGIENQNAIHYAMPVRNMLYNAMTYENQLQDIIRQNQEQHNHHISPEEFLSGVIKGTKLHPTITVTLYWGDKKWDGPETLKEMLLPYPPECEQFIDDININLISMVENNLYEKCKTDLGMFLHMVSASNDSIELERISSDKKFSNLPLDIANAISQCTDIKRPRNRTKGGGYNMCKAILELEKKNQDLKAIELIKNLMETTKQSFEEACRLLLISKNDMQRYKKMM